MDDPAIAAFREAQLDRRVRGAFRLLGVIAGLAVTFVLSVGALIMYGWPPFPVLVAGPFVTGVLLGEVAVLLLRMWRAHHPRIPRARVVHG